MAQETDGDGSDDRKLNATITSSGDIAGGAIGAAIGFLMGGPAGAVLGDAIGPAAAKSYTAARRTNNHKLHGAVVRQYVHSFRLVFGFAG